MVDGEWERSKALRTSEDNERFSILPYSITRYPYRSVLTLVVKGTRSDQTGDNLQKSGCIFLALGIERVCYHSIRNSTGIVSAT
jgi:hypothetical protein